MKTNFNLEDRTTEFAQAIIKLCKNIPKTQINLPIINQLIRSGTSVGANYMEANGASSKRDFKNKIAICRKEAKETQYWLKLLIISSPQASMEIKPLQQESKELALIFSRIFLNTKTNI